MGKKDTERDIYPEREIGRESEREREGRDREKGER